VETLRVYFSKVCEFKQPEELKQILADLEIGEAPASADRLLDMCKKIIKYSVKSGTPSTRIHCVSTNQIHRRIRYIDI